MSNPFIFKGFEFSFITFSNNQNIFVFQCNIGPGRQHAGSHEFVRGIGLLSPQNSGQRVKTQFEKVRHYPCVILIKREIIVDGSGGITDVDAGDTAALQNPENFFPHGIENPVHEFKSVGSLPVFQCVADSRILTDEHFIPHFDHGIGRRCHHQ